MIKALPVDTDDEISEAADLDTVKANPITANASIQPDIDVDMYKFEVNTNQTVDFDIDTADNGPNGLNSYLRLFNSQGEELGFNNNGMAPGENLLGSDAFLAIHLHIPRALLPGRLQREQHGISMPQRVTATRPADCIRSARIRFPCRLHQQIPDDTGRRDFGSDPTRVRSRPQ